jgi:oligoendopeptidase F
MKAKTTSWNLSVMFDSDDDPSMQELREEIEKSSKKFINQWNDKSYLESSSKLKQALDEYESFSEKYSAGGKEEFYFHLRTSLDQNNPKLKAKLQKITDFSIKIENEIQFFELSLAKIPQDKQKELLEDKSLQSYHYFLEKIFDSSKYLLSEDQEKILNLTSIPAHSKWVRMTSDFISREEHELKGEDNKITMKSFSDITSLMNSKNKEVRDAAATIFNGIQEKYSDVAEAEINAILENKKINDSLRKTPRPDFLRHLSDDVDSNVVDSLVHAVSSNYKLSQEFYTLKAKLFNVEKLKYHERNVPYGNIDESYDYDDSLELVSKVFTNLDPKFKAILDDFVNNGQIDVFPNKGKSSGAFCTDSLKGLPTYILLNHTNKLEDVRTLAHELGHGINDQLSRKQNALNFGVSTFTAEVASTFMEDFVVKELLKEADDELKLALLITKLDSDISAIFRQIAGYQFEQSLHEEYRKQGYLHKEEIGKLFQKHMKNYMGDSIEQSPGCENWWVYWGHIRMFFYVYSYASGLLISKSLQSKVKENPGFIKEVKEFLSAGLSDSPKNLFSKLGINVGDESFWNQGLTEIEHSLKEAEDLAKKLKKI